MERFIVDRIEEGIAVCENENGQRVNIQNPPQNCKEGDCLEFDGTVYTINHELTQKRRDSIISLFNRLKKK